MAKIIITGGTGLVGRALTRELLDRKDEVIILTRSKKEKKEFIQDGLSYAKWNPALGEIDQEAISEADYIIHLAGAGVADKRWTNKRKQEILKSRVDSGRLLSESLARMNHKIKAVISASAIGWYGPDPVIPNPDPFHEDLPASGDFLGQTCQSWEESIKPVTVSGVRLAILRTGIVFTDAGGALPEFRKYLRIGIAAILGKGKQVISWIHIDDLVNLYLYAIDKELAGVFNAVAPFPVSNKELVKKLAKGYSQFYLPVHVPALALKVILGEMSIEVLKSATVSSKKCETAGFQFRFPGIDEALKDIYPRRSA